MVVMEMNHCGDGDGDGDGDRDDVVAELTGMMIMFVYDGSLHLLTRSHASQVVMMVFLPTRLLVLS